MHNAIYTINRSGTSSCIKIKKINQMIKLVTKDLTISLLFEFAFHLWDCFSLRYVKCSHYYIFRKIAVFNSITCCLCSGTLCEVNINECISSPCLNGGTCVDGVNSFLCQCVPGYYNYFCKSVLPLCYSSPCVNGQCIDGLNRYSVSHTLY